MRSWLLMIFGVTIAGLIRCCRFLFSKKCILWTSQLNGETPAQQVGLSGGSSSGTPQASPPVRFCCSCLLGFVRSHPGSGAQPELSASGSAVGPFCGCGWSF
jgi:hypothetical protein